VATRSCAVEECLHLARRLSLGNFAADDGSCAGYSESAAQDFAVVGATVATEHCWIAGLGEPSQRDATVRCLGRPPRCGIPSPIRRRDVTDDESSLDNSGHLTTWWLEMMSAGKLMYLCTDRHLGMVWVVAQDVILNIVVVDEAKLAVRALTWFVGHALIVLDVVKRR
jgi:hypothetical protein